MKIEWIEFTNIETGLQVKRISFNRDVTLLVGLSGVGKTQILDAINYSLKLAAGLNVKLKPYEVSLGFSINKSKYVWSYKVANLNESELTIGENSTVKFVYEQLMCDGVTVFKMNSNTVEVVGYGNIPKPKKDESLISQYSEDENLKNIFSEIKKLYKVDTELFVRGMADIESYRLLRAKISKYIENNVRMRVSSISHLPPMFKIDLIKKYYKDTYDKILNAVSSIFNEVEDIAVVEDRLQEAFVVAIDVYGKKIYQGDISSGMLKTIYYIVELYTMDSDSIVLIDEFENGLGVNCIDVLSELMLFERRDLQFIVTSHHPKIINTIDYEKWKILNRDRNVVENIDAIDYGIGNSQHDAYFKLVNRWEFDGKI